MSVASTITADLLKSADVGVGAQAATKLPNSATPINYNFATQAAGPSVTGSVNKDDLTRAVGEQMRSERTAEAKKADAKPASRPAASPALSTFAARGQQRYEALFEKRNLTGLVRRSTQAGASARTRMDARSARYNPNAQPTLTEVNKSIATIAPVPDNKTVTVNQAVLEQKTKPGLVARAARTSLRLATVLGPAPVQVAAIALDALLPEAKSAAKPDIQPRRQNLAQLRAQPALREQVATGPRPTAGRRPLFAGALMSPMPA